MTRDPWRRIAAWAIDWLCILVWIAITLAVGLPLYLTGVTQPVGLLTLNIIGAVVMVIPVTVALAALEHIRGATVGKRVLHLQVARGEERPSWGRALLRNLLKVAVPWLIGHGAVFAVSSDPTPASAAMAVAAYVLPIAYVISLFIGRGLTPYDRIAGTLVRGGR